MADFFKDYLKVLAWMLVAWGLFGVGYFYASYKYDAKIATMVADHERQARVQAEQLKGQLQKERDDYAKATSNLLAQLRESENMQRDLADDAIRLRDELARRSRLPAAGNSSCGTIEKRLASCQGLLAESVELLAEGAGLSDRIAVKKDGLAAYFGTR
ncbi:MAG: hypothetical protein Q4E62_08285 [Sutterellaceae bacterium]|nr:hypothetical protein [Sutterellaceae bacterium]